MANFLQMVINFLHLLNWTKYAAYVTGNRNCQIQSDAK